MVGSAPPFQRLDQFPSIVSYWLLLFAVLQAFAFSSSANSSSVALPANRVTSSSLGSGTSMTPNGFRIPRHFSAATFRFASLSDFIRSPTAAAMPCADRYAFVVSTAHRLANRRPRRHPIPVGAVPRSPTRSALLAVLQKPEPAAEPFGGRGLDQDRHQDGDEGDRRDHLRAGRLHAQEQARQRRRNDAGLARPAHEQHLGKTPSRTAIRQRAQEYRCRPRNQHQDGDDGHADFSWKPNDGDSTFTAHRWLFLSAC